VSKSQHISAAFRNLFQLAKNHISPQWPESELPLIRHPEMVGNEEMQWWDDRRYLEELRSEIFDCVREGAFLWEMPALVWSERLYNAIDWPPDEAAALLDAWKISLAQQEEAA
jgi:hypothetical protein